MAEQGDPTSESIVLGPFSLAEIIGEGGMGQIWSGRHVKQDVPVAVKVIHGDRFADERICESFRREARAMARLNHDNIIGIYDFGQISAAVEEMSAGRLRKESPYLVIEYARRGSLLDNPRPSSWGELKWVLMQVLEGLAHAHAHELVHRDLKPGNILVADESGRRQLKLADFGIAYVEGGESEVGDDLMRHHSGGTPAYMAPEQIRGLWREVGPWTDLYALGCVAFELATGQPPFVRRVPRATMLAHLDEAPPALLTTLSVPAGFGDWLGRLLEKEGAHRFQTAADAAWALAMLDRDGSAPEGADEVEEPLEPAILRSESDVMAGSLTQLYGGDQTLVFERAERTLTLPGIDVSAAAEALRQTPVEQAPMPKSWRAMESASLPPLSGTGLGVFRSRQIGLVGRVEERDRLWEMLARVHRGQGPEAMVLRGPSGCGKSALAEWVGRRAVEVGAASLMGATFSPSSSPDQAMGAMLVRHFRAREMPEEHLEAHLFAALQQLNDKNRNRLDAEVLARVMSRMKTPQAQTWRLALLRLLRALSARRPVVLWFDDAQWAGEALELVNLVLGDPRLGVLCVLTVRDEALSERGAEARQLAQLAAHDRVREQRLRPLTLLEQRQLVARLLPLQGDLVEELAQRTSGNPFFAVELLSDWIERRLLIAADGIFQMPAGPDPELPDSLHQAWMVRLKRVLSGVSATGADDARKAIELAACLGRFVDPGEWALACRLANIDVCQGLLKHLRQERLLHHQEGSLVFSHEMLRESILRHAAEARRLPALHRICLQVIDESERCGAPEHSVEERRCRHMLGAGLHQQAVGPLIEVTTALLKELNHHAAMRCAFLAETALQAVEEPDEQELLQVWNLLSWSLLRINSDLALEYVQRVRDLARLPRDSKVMADSERLLAVLALNQGNTEPAEAHFRVALELYQSSGDEVGVARTRLGLGDMQRLSGRHDEARLHLKEALKIFYRTGPEGRTCETLRSLGQTAIAVGDFAEAGTYLREALALAEGLSESQLMMVRGALADVLRYLGDLAESERLHRLNYEFFREQDSPSAHLHALNVGFTLVMQERFQETAILGTSAAEGMKRQHYTIYLGGAYLLILCGAAGMKNRALWDQTFPLAATTLATRPIVERDIAWAAEEAARLAKACGWHEAAKATYEMALPLWEALDDEEAKVRIGQLLGAK